MVIRRPSSLILSIVIVVGAALLFVLQLNQLPLEALFALPLVLLLPGYALTFLFFNRNALGNVERVLFGVALSFALTILGGVLLNLTPWGLDAATWLLVLVGLTLVLGIVGILRQREPAFVSWQVPRRSISVSDLVLYELSILLLFAALMIARVPPPAAQVQGYTALWMLPAEAQAQKIEFGFKSQELDAETFRIELRMDGQVVQAWDNITLQPGEEWRNAFPLAPGKAAPSTVEAYLYRRADDTAVYRRVLLQFQTVTRQGTN